jgi:hypothetical protein
MADFDAQLPVRALAANFTTEVANAAGTTINPAEDYAQASTTSGENGVLIMGATTTSAPTYVTATSNPLSLDTSGNLRVTIDSSTSLQNVNVTEWNSVTLGSPTAYGTPPGAINVIGVNAFVSNTITVAGNLTNNNAAPAATNIGALVARANAAAPTWTEGDQVLLSEDLSGNLRVLATQAAIPVVLTYFTDAAVASGATVTHSLAGPVTLDEIWASGSGEIKVTIAIGVTASEVTYANGFTSSANQNFNFSMKNGYVIPVGSSCKITIKNRDTAAQDTYLTFVSH